MRPTLGLLLLGLASVVLLACSGQESEVGKRRQAATALHDRVVGFEAPTEDWAASGGAILGVSASTTQGASSLSVTPNGHTEIGSIQVSAPGEARSTATLDLQLSQALAWGEVRLVVRVPSAGLWWSDLGGQPLAGRAPGVFHTFGFAVPEQVRDALNGSAPDVDYRIVLNVPAGSGTYLLDNLLITEAASGDEEQPIASNIEFSVAVPSGSAIADVMIAATERITVDDRSTLAQAGNLSHVVNLGPATLDVGAAVHVYADVTSVGDVNFLRSQSHVYGNIVAGGAILQQDGTVQVDGTTMSGVTIVPAVTSWTVAWPSAGPNLLLPPDAPNVDLPEGAYDSVQVFPRASLTLRSGTYFLNSLVVEPEAHLHVDTSTGPVIVYVRDTLRLHVSLDYTAGERGQLLFAYLGSEPASFEEALVASVVAPNSTIELRRPASLNPHEGSFFGKAVHLYSDSTVLHRPLDWGFLCPAGDTDGDGVLDCFDECWNDAQKVTAGVCGCGTSDADTDGDRVPDCVDQCPEDVGATYRGSCGCPSDPAPEGTPCNDGITEGTFICDGAGMCGDPESDAPDEECIWRTLGSRVYWICNGGGAFDDAVQRCGQSSTRRLVQIDTPRENALIASLVEGESWTGGADRSSEGEWFWTTASGSNLTHFWTGGRLGKRKDGRFASWEGGAPPDDTELNCLTVSPDVRWRARNCNESRPYVCEGTFGPPRTGMPQGPFPPPKGPCDIVPGWQTSSNGANGCGPEQGGDQPDVDECVHPPGGSDEAREEWLLQRREELELCDEFCGPGSNLSEDECAQYCHGEAAPPPPGSECSNTAPPLAELDLLVPGTCAVLDPHSLEGTPEEVEAQVAAAQDCSGATVPGFPGAELRCGVKTRCFHLDDVDGELRPRSCGTSSDCLSGHFCDLSRGKCIDPNTRNACQTSLAAGQLPDRRDTDGICFGQCFTDVGCGTTTQDLLETIFPWLFPPDPSRCGEVRYCGAPKYTADVDRSDFDVPWSFTDNDLPSEANTPAPAYATDFDAPCDRFNGCEDICLIDPATGKPFDLTCPRRSRHLWCTNNASAPGDRLARVGDVRSGRRGEPSTPISFTVEPASALEFSLDPLPNGVADFSARAGVGVRTTVDFNVLGTSGKVEVVDLRAEISTSLCRVRTDNSRLEVVGVDFLPEIAPGVIFDSDDYLEGDDDSSASEVCQKAVTEYVDAFDRAKKALRDAQELIHQYKALAAEGRTFAPDFCETIAGPGMRPRGMEGSCPETPEQVINRFVDYYQLQATQGLQDAIQRLATAALDTNALSEALGFQSGHGYPFYAKLDKGGEETVTLVALQFFIGPVPALLEISSYVHYGMVGGFGVNLEPSLLLFGGGDFATVGADVGPYANSGVTLFVGAGFNLGVLKLAVGVEGGVTLGHVSLPASVAAGLRMQPESDSLSERPLPDDLQGLTDGSFLFPAYGGPQKYNFSFNYRYGVNLAVTNILSGYIDGSVKVKFAFFSKKFAQRLASFSSGVGIGPLQLIGGGNSGGVTIPASGDPLWKRSYETVPLVRLNRLPQLTAAQRETLTEDASLDSSRVQELYYDSLCTCVEEGHECHRDADCCDGALGCVPGLNGVNVCGQVTCIDEGQPCGDGIPGACCADTHCNVAGICSGTLG